MVYHRGMGAHEIGVVGLGVMGQNLALNMEEKGFPVAVWDREPPVVDRFARAVGQKRIACTRELGEFAAALSRPRKILMMVKAGAPVDATIANLVPHLEPGDLLIDGGNEF